MTHRPAVPPPDPSEVRRVRPQRRRQTKLLLLAALAAALSGTIVASVGTASAAVAPQAVAAAAALATTPAPSTTPNTSPNPCPTGPTVGPSSTVAPQPTNNGDTQPPTQPGPLRVTSCPNGIVVIEWNASTDNVGVAYYSVIRVVGDVVFHYVTTRNRIDLPSASGTFSYGVAAVDAAGNSSPQSTLVLGNPSCPPPAPTGCSSSPTSASPTGPDTQPPTAPGQPVVTVTNGNATITWAPSTDNVGVANYLLYDQYTDIIQIRTLPGNTTTYGVSVGTQQHIFYLFARDAAGNTSPVSPRTTVGTPPTCAPLTTCNPPTSTGCTVSYVVYSEWPGAFQGQITIRNTRSTAVNGWQLRWAFANGQQISQMWGGTYVQSGANVTVTNVPWTATIPPNGTVSIGFLASWSGTNAHPTSFTLNGGLCGTG
jgi:hypothetical protein